MKKYFFIAFILLLILICGCAQLIPAGGPKVDFALFKAELEKQINTAARTPGNIVYPMICAPTYAEKVCFADLDNYDHDLCMNELDKSMCDAWKDKTENVFLIPKKPGVGVPIKNDLIDLKEPLLCIDVVEGNLELKLTWKDNKALIEIPEPIPEPEE